MTGRQQGAGDEEEVGGVTPPTSIPPQQVKDRGSMGRRMGIAALMLSVSTLLSGVLGFLRDVLVTSWYAAGIQSDAYYSAFKLPDMMNYFLAGGTLSITFIPLFSAYLARGEEEQGWQLFSTIATVLGAILVLVTLVMMALAPWIVPVIFPGFDSTEQVALTVTMTRIVLPAQVAFYIGGLIQATLFSREVFWPAAISPLIYNVMIIAGGFFLGESFGIMGFSIGALVGAVCGPLLVPLWAARKELRYSVRLDVRSEGFKRFLMLTLPLMFGATLVTVDSWLHAYFGSSHAEGSVTLLNHSRKLMVFLFAIIGQASGQAALPFLSKLYASGKEQEMGAMLSGSLARVVFLALFASAGLAVVGEPLVYVLYHHGEFSQESAQITTRLLWLFCIGMGAWVGQTIAARAFYARQDTLTPMVVGTVVLAVSLPIYWLLDRELGVYGLALATSISMTLNVVAVVLTYRWRSGGELPLGPLTGAIGRGAVGATACVAVSLGAGYVLRELFGVGEALTVTWQALTLCGVEGGIFVAVMLAYFWFASPPESEVVMSKIRRKVLGLRRAK